MSHLMLTIFKTTKWVFDSSILALINLSSMNKALKKALKSSLRGVTPFYQGHKSC